MSRTMRLLRTAGVLGLTVLGAAAPSWASYGGGACFRCAPAPVVQTQCNVVALAPQCQTVTQTVYETVYENQPYTVMETRYRQASGPSNTRSCGRSPRPRTSRATTP